MLIVEPSRPDDPGALALLQQSHALMRSLFPSEANHFLSIEALKAPHIRFFAARRGDEVLGTGALALMDGYAEIKSMFTSPAARGQGVGSALLRQLEDCAVEEGISALYLETGSGLDAAHRLYARHGFQPCSPFGDYQACPFSLFFHKQIAN